MNKNNYRNLKLLNVSDNPFLEDKELVCILLVEKIPQLQIQGVDYLAALNNEQKEAILRLYSDKQNQITDDNNDKETVDAESESEKLRNSDL